MHDSINVLNHFLYGRLQRQVTLDLLTLSETLIRDVRKRNKCEKDKELECLCNGMLVQYILYTSGSQQDGLRMTSNYFIILKKYTTA